MKTVEDSNLDRYQWENLIDRWIFNELDRKLLKRRLLDGVLFEELAEELNISSVQARYGFHTAEKQLFKRL